MPETGVTQDADTTRPLLVATGASAGGVRALQEFFSAIQADTGAAFAVVVHLDPEHDSELPQIISSCTAMPVVQVRGREKLEPNRIYVIPPDRHLKLIDREISAEPFSEPRGRRLPIDMFFRSVAEQLGDDFAVVLSGAGADGAIGVRAVKEAGGIILVQDPTEAEHASMPRSAINTGVVDFVLPVRELAARLSDLIRLKRSSPVESEPAELDEDLLRRILGHVRVRTGHDFSKYKRSTVLRRIARRMAVSRTERLAEYYELLRSDSDEAPALLADLLISVTTFFRDADSFEALQKSVLPSLFDREEPTGTVRVWVPGCATGEEAYSIGMLLQEEAARYELHPPIQIFGTDLDARSLSVAREGRYPATIEADVSEERLRRFFVRDGHTYRIRQELRDLVLFAVHDLLQEPPFSRVGLITCRNLLIYLDRDLQEQVINTFHYALNPGGYLMLGSSESAEQPSGLFRLSDRNARIYQSTAIRGEKPRVLPTLLDPLRQTDHVAHGPRAVSPSAALKEASIHRRELEKVAPPSVLVDDVHRVLHISDTAGRFMQPAGGPLSGDLVDLVRPELRFELRSALNRLFEQRAATLTLPIMVRFNGAPHRVYVHVRTADDSERPRTGVVMFIEGDAVEEAEADGAPATTEKVSRLAQELELTQARLRTVREESDAANEELRAANEELQSINEEYRSTSEELETSKEELQSINEELQTVNVELKLKLETISRAHSDLQNLMAATDFGTLFLDSNLQIKRFTDRVRELFSITPSDEGRPITDFAHQLEHADLTRDIRLVIADLAPVRREVRSRANRWYDIRMRPYRTVDDKIDGVVITFVDVTERRKVEEALRKSEHQLRQQRRLVELSHDPIFVWNYDGGIVDWNRGGQELYGYTREEALGKAPEQLLGTVVGDSNFAELKAALLRDRHWRGELQHRAKDGRVLTVETELVLESVDEQRLVLESVRDVTQRKALLERQQMLLSELTHRVKNTLAVAQAIATQTLQHTPTPRAFVERFSGRLEALARSHGLLVASQWTGADLATLTRVQLKPYAMDGRLDVEGPPVSLPADVATPFGLVLHELATNAAKYGALSDRTGNVSVTWALSAANAERHLTLTWRESGGSVVHEPASRGLGSSLIEHAIPGASVHREFRAQGLVCTVDLVLPPEDDHGSGRSI